MVDEILVWALSLLGSAVGLALAFVGLLYLTRSNPLESIRILSEDGGSPGVAEADFRRQVETHVGTALGRNHLDLLFDGDGVFPPLLADLREARDVITLHVFWHRPGRLADELHDLLVERCRCGVQVFLLWDRYGAAGMDADYWESLAEAGCEVRCFRDLAWNTAYKWQQRSHMRSVVIDGRVGYTGGFAIDDRWLGDGRHPGQWRDTSVRLEGPIVEQLQAAFVADWVEATGQLLLGDRLFPEDLRDDGSHRSGLLFNSPSVGSTDAERYYAISIFGARDTLYITSAYFVPGGHFRRLLGAAAERGVDVRILTPGANTDRPSTWYAARANYEELLASGVRIYEYGPTMVHAKTLVADRIWCSVGTMNFDNRSMSLNEEVTLLALDRNLAGELHDRFLEDLELSRELELAAFRRRPARERAAERFWRLFSPFL